ncbi:cytochrome c biogenesis CcdA family protein [Nocardioides sp. GCM10027113]|uniref:cytochrome c biogenesis CcdA family protein n=1 Tax=unclassified Nocardioides TaxID=2615069 RepID=UPI00361426D0
MTEVTTLAAVAAGVLALPSPCSALLLPSFFAYAFASPTALVGRTAVFYLGLASTLVPLGVGASAASTLFYGHRALLISVAGWTVIGLGVLQILGRGFAVPGVGRLHAGVMGRDGARWLSTYLLGSVYGLAGFCSGPVLGAILTVAATRDTPVAGGLLLAAYAFGMTVPLFLLALAWTRFDLGRRGWLRGRSVRLGPVTAHTTSLVSGLLLVGVGVLFVRYDGTAGLTGALGLGDTTDLEFAAQQLVTEWAARVPAWALPLTVAAGAAWVAWRRREPGGPRKQEEPRPLEGADS